MSSTGSAAPTGVDHAGPGRWIGLALGVPLIAWGVRGIVMDAARTHPAELGRWLVGSAVVHDAVLLPVVLGIAVATRRLASDRVWPLVRWALSTTGVVLLVSWPFVRGYGQRSSNPSLLPRDYATGVVVAIAAVWLVTGAVAWFWRRGHTAGGA